MEPGKAKIFYSDQDYEIRPAKSTDEFRDVWWGFMQSLGWNRGYYDLDTYMNPSLGSGMILLIDKASNEPVGHVSAIINPGATGWVSMFIVDEKHRGKGMGRELFKAAVRDFADNGTEIIGLDGVVEQRGTYERRNFVSSPLGTIRIMIRPLVAKKPLPGIAIPSGLHVVDIRKVPQGLLVEHELKLTGFNRPKLWSDEHMFHRPDVGGVAVVSKSNPETVDDLKAWAITRRCSGGIRIGPLYAEDKDAAKAALVAAMDSATPDVIQKVPLPGNMENWTTERIREEATLVTEVWGGNADAVALFDELEWQPAGVEYYRMWTDGKATTQQSEGGAAQSGVYAIFDAAVG